MNIIPTKLSGLVLIDPQVFHDHRGYFFEIYQQQKYESVLMGQSFVQDNRSNSIKRTLRGLHGQFNHPQGKLITAVVGEIFDVVVDLRVGSPTFGQWESFVLSGESSRQVFVPAGFAHGFVVTSEKAIVEYKCTDFYNPGDEFSLLWNDPELNIPWPEKDPLLSKKDAAGLTFAEYKKKLTVNK